MPAPQRIWTYQDRPVAQALATMIQHGISVFPVHRTGPSAKRPKVSWAIYQSAAPSTAELARWLTNWDDDFGIGLVTGPTNGWVVIDADNEAATLWAEPHLPDTPVKQRTGRGVHFIYRQGQRAIPTKANIAGQQGLDVRGTGGFIIIAPSVINGEPRRFELTGNPDPSQVSTLDDLGNFDEVFSLSRQIQQDRLENGASAEIVRDEATGQVIDGRGTYLRNVIYARGLNLYRVLGSQLTAAQLAQSAWEIFERGANLNDGRWDFEHALEKAAYFLDRVAQGEINIPAATAGPASSVSPDSLTPPQAIDQLRGVVQGFLDYRAEARTPQTVRHLLIRSPAGLGKTTNTISLAAQFAVERRNPSFLAMTTEDIAQHWDPRLLLYVRTHNLAREIKGVIERELDSISATLPADELARWRDVPLWRGRQNEDESGNAPCLLASQVSRLVSQGYSVGRNLCQSLNWATGAHDECAHFQSCEYIATRRKRRPFTVLMSAELPYANSTNFVWTHSEHDPIPGETGFFKPARDGSTFLIDEAPLEHLLDRDEIPRSALDQLEDSAIRDAIHAGLTAPEGLLIHLRSQGLTVQNFRRAARQQDEAEKRAQRVLTPGETSETRINQRTTVRRYRLGALLTRLADELSLSTRPDSYSLRLLDNGRLLAQGRRAFALSHMPGLLLDATGDIEVLRPFMPGIELAADIRVERNAFVTQVSDNTFSRNSILDDEESTPLRGATLAFIRETANRIAQQAPSSPLAEAEEGANRRTLVVTYRPLRMAWTGETGDSLPAFSLLSDSPVDIAHFGAIRGLDQFKNHSCIIIVGRQEPNAAAMEDQARALWYDAAEAILCVPSQGNDSDRYPRRVGTYCVSGLDDQPTNSRGVAFHPDPRVYALLKQSREAETLQAIDRLRLVHSDTKKEVYVLCNVPLPGLTVDRLLTWEELLAGGTRLERALAICDQRGWQAFPMVPAWLTENFPELWATETAARRWREATPHEANRSYSYWGALVRFRFAGQGGNPSFAYVRHSVDDAAGAIGARLGRAVVIV